MRALALALAALVFPGPAGGQTPAEPTRPSHHEVGPGGAGVRAAPDPAARITGRLASGAGPVEVVDEVEGWGRIGQGEGGGWVEMERLRPLALPRIGDTALPEGLLCSGTEPFWSLDLGQPGRARLSELGAPEQWFAVVEAEAARGRSDPTGLWLSGAGRGVAHIARTACTDGMSDRPYAYAITLSLDGAEGRQTLAGCCRVPLTAAD